MTAATRASPAWQTVDEAWDRLLEGLRSAESALRWFATAVDEVDDVAIADLAEAGERQELLLSDLANTIRIGTELAGKFASALDAPEAGRVFWLERQGATDRIAFRSAPLDVSGLLQERLFKKRAGHCPDVGDARRRRATATTWHRVSAFRMPRR